MPRSSTVIGSDIAAVKANNTACQNEINRCNSKMQQLEDKINNLNAKKQILEETYSVYSDLKEYIVSHLAGLEETSVCIKEIKSEATSQISDKIDVALQSLDSIILRIDTAVRRANSEYNTAYSQKTTYETKLSNGQTRLQKLGTELTEAKEYEIASQQM